MISRPEVINSLGKLFPRGFAYLEIGVDEGTTFFSIKAQRKVAVDPKFRFSVEQARKENPFCEFHEVTSDLFFSTLINYSEIFQIIYLDGLHTFEQTLRDFTNAIQFLSSDGVIIIDDVVPNSYPSGLPNEEDSVRTKQFLGDPDHSWMGDTYKVVFFIEAFFPTFELRTIADNHGQAVVWRAFPARKGFRSYSARQIADLEFLDVIKEFDVFKRKPCAEIIEEFNIAQCSIAAMPDNSFRSS